MDLNRPVRRETLSDGQLHGLRGCVASVVRVFSSAGYLFVAFPGRPCQQWESGHPEASISLSGCVTTVHWGRHSATLNAIDIKGIHELKSWKAVTATIVLAGVTGTVGMSHASAAPESSRVSAVSSARTTPSEAAQAAAIPQMINTLSAMPTSALNADVTTTTGKHEFLQAFSEANNNLQRATGAGSVAPAFINLSGCGWEVAKFAVTVGILGAKMLKELKEAKKIAGSVKNLIRLIKAGHGAHLFGEEARRSWKTSPVSTV